MYARFFLAKSLNNVNNFINEEEIIVKKYMKWFGFVLVLVALFVLVACDGGRNSSNVINGIDVPPVPDAVEDAATVGGVDTDGDIVRDIVERMLAEEFGDDPVFYEQAKAHALAEQVAIMDPTPENVAVYIDSVRCIKDSQVLDDFKKISAITIDTEDREDAYLEAFAGAYITSRGC